MEPECDYDVVNEIYQTEEVQPYTDLKLPNRNEVRPYDTTNTRDKNNAEEETEVDPYTVLKLTNRDEERPYVTLNTGNKNSAEDKTELYSTVPENTAKSHNSSKHAQPRKVKPIVVVLCVIGLVLVSALASASLVLSFSRINADMCRCQQELRNEIAAQLATSECVCQVPNLMEETEFNITCSLQTRMKN